MTVQNPATNGLAVPAAWYPDPESATGERWWNGSQWTSHTRASEPFETDLAAEAGSPMAWSAVSGPLAVSGALMMLGISIFGGLVVGIITLGLAWLVWGPAIWVTSIIWGCTAAGNQRGTQVITAYR